MVSSVDTSIDPNAAAAAAAAANKANGVKSSSGTDSGYGVNFDTFLIMLTTQLKNQDPLNPMDGTQFTAQIAQFSQLEQQIRSNSYLQTLSQQQSYAEQSLAVGAIGREALIPGKTASFTSSTGTLDFGYKLEDNASNVKISISDSTGKVVKTITGDGTAGPHVLNWDGKGDDGTQYTSGAFTIAVAANDTKGVKVTATPYTYAVVREVATDGAGGVNISTLDNRSALFSDVLSIRAYMGGQS